MFAHILPGAVETWQWPTEDLDLTTMVRQASLNPDPTYWIVRDGDTLSIYSPEDFARRFEVC